LTVKNNKSLKVILSTMEIWILCWDFFIVFLLYFYNTLIITNFNVLKYI